MAVALASIPLIVIGALALNQWQETHRFKSGNRRQQIERMAASLKDALVAIETIRGEILVGERTLSELEQRAEYQKEMSKLTATEAQAVRQVLRAELDAERRSSIMRDLGIGMLFFVLGVVTSRILR